MVPGNDSLRSASNLVPGNAGPDQESLKENQKGMSCIILGTQNYKIFGVGGADSQESRATPPCWERRNDRTRIPWLVTGRLALLAGLELSSVGRHPSSCLPVPFSKPVVIADIYCMCSMWQLSVWFSVLLSPQQSCVRSVVLCD